MNLVVVDYYYHKFLHQMDYIVVVDYLFPSWALIFLYLFQT